MGLGLNYSKIVQIDEHIVTLPEPTKDRSKILFIDDKPEDAFWRRDTSYPSVFFDFIPNHTKVYQDATLYDQDGILISCNKEDSDLIIRLYTQEIDRRRNGVFFKNGEDLEYLTGHHYFILQWMKMLGLPQDYGAFRKFQRDHFYLKNHVWSSEHILGLDCSKPKKTGLTQLEAGYYLNKSTLTKGQTMGIMSLKKDTAAGVNMRYFFHGLDGLPKLFQPQVKVRSDQDGYILFDKKPSRSAKAFLKADNNEDVLNSYVYCAPTKEAGFDSPLMNDIWFDEFPKYDTESKVEPLKVFLRNQETVKIQDIINGKIWITSYPPETTTEGFKQAKKVYFESKLSTKNELGRTKTQMICYHISSINSYSSAFDKYGNCDKTKAYYLNDIERQAVKDDKVQALAKVRQYARTEKEAWSEGSVSSAFDPIRMADLIDELEDLLRSKRQYQIGHLEWANPLWNVGKMDKRPKGVFGAVRQILLSNDDIENGKEDKMFFFENIPANKVNLPLNYSKDDDGNLYAPTKAWAVTGIDPTDYQDAEAINEGSKNAMHTMIVHDELMNTAMRRIGTKVLFSEYFWRSDKPRETYEDFVKQIIFTGCMVVIEANKAAFATMLIEEGLGRYLLVRNEDGVICQWEPGIKYTLIKTQGSGNTKTIEDLIKLGRTYLLEANPEYGEIDYGKLIKTLRLLQQLSGLDPAYTKIYDLAMSFLYTLFGHEHYMEILAKPQDENYSEDKVLAVLHALNRCFA